LPDSQQSFDALLYWLDRDRNAAGEKYETIRSGLVRIFVSKGFSDAEHLADESIDRVIKRLPDIIDTYEGQPARYFHGVARNVIFEASRPREIATELSPVWVDPKPTNDPTLECLERCLQFLPLNKRDLILDYYLYEGHDKIEQHKSMARELAITEGALRGRAHHIRAKLEDCVRKCVATPVETEPTTEHIVGSGVLNERRQP
jgi:DNA-directed RNA polymerase specialized sigma24 family protein